MSISDEDARQIKTVADAVQFIESHKNKVA